MRQAFEVRSRFRVLYEDFRPPKLWWRLWMIARKFIIAVVVLVLNADVEFQASLLICLMFVSYVLQTTHRPFLAIKPVSDQFLNAISDGGKGPVVRRRQARAWAPCVRARDLMCTCSFPQAHRDSVCVPAPMDEEEGVMVDIAVAPPSARSAASRWRTALPGKGAGSAVPRREAALRAGKGAAGIAGAKDAPAMPAVQEVSSVLKTAFNYVRVPAVPRVSARVVQY